MNKQFSKKFKNYKFIDTSNKNEPPEAVFIKNAILALFDGGYINNTNDSIDGIIDKDEFNQISKQEYEKLVKEIQAYYKQHYKKNLEYHIPTYEELEKMLANKQLVKDINSGICEKQNCITIDELAEPIIPDGIIGQSNQEGSGSCYQEAADIALSITPKGRKLLSRSLKKISEKEYKITLYGANQNKNGEFVPIGYGIITTPKSYKITQAELKEAQEELLPNGLKKYNSGDADVVLLNMAIEKYRKETQKTPKLPQNRKKQKGYDDFLSSGRGAVTMQLITGKIAYQRIFKTCSKSNNSYTRKETIQTVLSTLTHLARQQKNMAMTCSFVLSEEKNINDLKLYENHEYAVKKIDNYNKQVIIINPHNGKYDEISMPYADFAKYVCRLDNIYL